MIKYKMIFDLFCIKDTGFFCCTDIRSNALR